jgi:hypothetical protein
MKMYRTERHKVGITEIEVTRATTDSIWIMSRGKEIRRARYSYEQHFDTWEEAKKYLVNELQDKIDSAIRRLDDYNDELGRVLELKEE